MARSWDSDQHNAYKVGSFAYYVSMDRCGILKETHQLIRRKMALMERQTLLAARRNTTSYQYNPSKSS
jgi:hypothetical protein